MPSLLKTSEIRYLLSLGRRMPRDRFQNGRVEETGKRVKKWKGHYYVYVRQPDGTEKRAHRAKVLGLKSAMRKREAEEELRKVIERETKQSLSAGAVPLSGKDLTVRWFFENRFRPMMEPKWKESSRKELIGNIERYVLRLIGETPLAKLDKFELQMQANQLATKFSDSVVEKYLVWSKAILEEAVDQDFIPKNPARKLTKPQTRAINKRTANEREIRVVMQCMEGRVRVVLMLSFVLGLRPGELLALRWNDVLEASLRIDENARYGKLYVPKTKASEASVWLPAEMRSELLAIRTADAQPEDFIFPNAISGVYRLDNFRKRILKPALLEAKNKAKSLGLPGESLKSITFQVCRRTCGTLMQNHGNVKDIQAHLRHAQASTTLGVYVQEIPESVQNAVHSLYRKLFDLAPSTDAVQ